MWFLTKSKWKTCRLYLYLFTEQVRQVHPGGGGKGVSGSSRRTSTAILSLVQQQSVPSLARTVEPPHTQTLQRCPSWLLFVCFARPMEVL